MNTKDDFTILTFKMLLSALSLVIILPMMGNLIDTSFYVTVIVYILGKLVELVSKVPHRQPMCFFILYILGIIASIIAVAMCFFGLVETNGSNSITSTFGYNVILIILSAFVCFTDVADFTFGICKLCYTKRKLRQF
jgi:hypothetical protein